MKALRRFPWSVLLAAALLAAAAPAFATTLVRRGLEQLTLESDTIVEANVLEIHSFWNPEHTFILTDVRARPARVLKGQPVEDLRFTVLGGTVGETTTLVVGGPVLAPGSDYVLFLGKADLPGARGRLTVRELSQGVFTIGRGRARSQAAREPLLPDAQGRDDVPGGDEGMPLETLTQRILELR